MKPSTARQEFPTAPAHCNPARNPVPRGSRFTEIPIGSQPDFEFPETILSPRISLSALRLAQLTSPLRVSPCVLHRPKVLVKQIATLSPQKAHNQPNCEKRQHHPKAVPVDARLRPPTQHQPTYPPQHPLWNQIHPVRNRSCCQPRLVTRATLQVFPTNRPHITGWFTNTSTHRTRLPPRLVRRRLTSITPQPRRHTRTHQRLHHAHILILSRNMERRPLRARIAPPICYVLLPEPHQQLTREIRIHMLVKNLLFTYFAFTPIFESHRYIRGQPSAAP